MQLKIEIMKNIFKLLLILFITISCKAQSPIFDIMDFQHRIQDINGAYYKDINNLLDPFVGTYLYTNGNTTLKIVLQKKTMSFALNKYYEDVLIGEYQYIENGVEKVNTLNKLNINYSDKSNHSIDGNLIISQGSPGCEECLYGEKALYIGLVDGTSNNTARLIIRRVFENGVPAIKISLGWRTRYKRPNDPMPLPPSFPSGYYTLVKQL